MRYSIVVGGFAAMWIGVASCAGNGTSNAGAGGHSTGMSSTGMNSTGAGGGPNAAIIDAFCNAVATSFCEADYACCTDPGHRPGKDIESCKESVLFPPSFYLYFCENPPFVDNDRADLEASLEAGTTIFDQTQLDTCLTRLKSLSAGGAVCDESPAHVVNTLCMNAFRAQIADGDPCPWQQVLFGGSFVQCKDGRCDPYTHKCVSFLKAGDACPWNDSDWAQPSNTICDYTHDEWCMGAVKGGGGGDAGTPGICKPLGEVGDACQIGQYKQCRSQSCPTGTCLFPDPKAEVCYNYM